MRMGFAEGASNLDVLGGWSDPLRTSSAAKSGSPMARDEQLGAIFRQMRAVVGLNEIAIARLVGTDLTVIMDLEAGIGEGLPKWPELVRIVERYASLAGVDPSPIMTRLMQISMPAPPRVAHAAPLAMPTAGLPVPPLSDRFAPPRAGAPASPATAPVAPGYKRRADAVPPVRVGRAQPPIGTRPAVRAAAEAPMPMPRVLTTPSSAAAAAEDLEEVATVPPPRKTARWMRVASGPFALVLILAGLYFAVLQLPRVAYASIGYFPSRLQGPVRNVVDLAILQTAAVRDGLRWIDVGDPRIRKTDRLKGQ